MRKVQLNVRPLSVNEAWQGKRYKTRKYSLFEREMLLKLPACKIDSCAELYFRFGFSSKLSDIDNPVKMVLDCLQKKYGFNDRDIFRLTIEKEIVKKGDEYIYIEIK